MEQIITIKRKDIKGTVRIRYGVDPYLHGVTVNFVGSRGGVAVRQWLGTSNIRSFGLLLAAVSQVSDPDRTAVTKFCGYLFFNMSRKLDVWLKNADEVSAALLMVADIYEKAGVNAKH